MKTINLYSCIVLASLIIARINTMDPPIVVACNFDVMSKNADTSNIISNALLSARHILSCFSWGSLAYLKSTLAHMKQRGIEIAATTPGITNTIAKLFAELQRDGYGAFTDTAISCFNEMGVNPVADPEALSLLQKVKSFNVPTIGMGNQDSLEHEIYARKMLTEQTIDVHTLYDGIVTIPTLDEQALFDSNPADYLIRSQANPRWLVARNTSPSSSFSYAVGILANQLTAKPTLWSIDSKEQLAVLVNALLRACEHRSPSPETGKMFDEIMQQCRVISPTKV